MDKKTKALIKTNYKRAYSGDEYKIKQFKHLTETMQEMYQEIVKCEDIDARRKLKPLLKEASKTVEYVSRPYKAVKHRVTLMHDHNRHGLFVACWDSDSGTDYRFPEPLLIYNTHDLAKFSGNSRTTIWNKLRHNDMQEWWKCGNRLYDPRLPAGVGYISNVYIKKFHRSEESEQELIDIGLEHRLNKIRKKWSLMENALTDRFDDL